MKKNFLFIAALLFSVTFLKAQLPTGSYNDYFREGTFLLLEDNYDLALKNFLQAHKLDSSSANVNFNVGFCYLNSSTKKGLAERYLEQATKHIDKNYRQDDPSEKAAPPLAYFYYARALHINYKFDEALTQYDIFGKNYARDKTSKADVAYHKAQTNFAKELVGAPINVKIENLGDSINSEYPDFSPVLSADERTLIYTSRRNTSTGGERTPDGQYFEDVVISYKDENGKWSSPKPISTYINSNGHEGSVNLSPDGQTLIVYRDDQGDGNIYFSTWDGKDWSSLQSFGSDVNTKAWEPHACLSADQNTLYFISDRKGGFGGRDIYSCVKLPNGKWSLAKNLGPEINTQYDEDGVYIHPDGVTLIFASKGHKSMGGFDVFTSTIEPDRKFSAPVNIGYPINTTDDDVFFVTSPDGKRGYFSSSNDGGFGEKDIYSMYIPDAKEKPLALFKGSIIPADGEKLPDDLMIIVTNKETGEIVGTYRPKENGSFTTILPPNKNYNFSYQSKGEEFYNEDIYVSEDVAYQEIKKEINLEPVSLLGKVKIKNKAAILNTVVLNNPKDKKPVSNAKVFLTENSGTPISYSVDENGKKEGTVLAYDKKYTMYAEDATGKKSAVSSFNTDGVKGSKTITQVVYMDGKKVKDFDLFLNVIVVNKKRKALANTNVTVTGNDGYVYNGVTDSKGKIKNIELDKNVNYDLVGTKNGVSSDKAFITTMNANTRKSFDKTIIIDTNPDNAIVSNGNGSNDDENGGTDYSCGTKVKYKYYFSYNKNSTEEKAEWDNLINGIVAKSKECNPDVAIYSSASQVPTHAYKSNQELAETRANNLEEKIKTAVSAKGGDASKINFRKIHAVRGPQYENDYKNTKKYGKFQYVRVIAK